jgi:flagellar hook-basal body complex protein FliE
MAIEGLGSIGSIGSTATRPSTGSVSPQESGFGDALAKLVESVDSSAGEANQAVGRMLDGSGDVHEAMIAMQRAEQMLQLTVQIRNKLVQAYQDVMRMSV